MRTQETFDQQELLAIFGIGLGVSMLMQSQKKKVNQRKRDETHWVHEALELHNGFETELTPKAASLIGGA